MQISVKDEGIGVTEKDAPNVFDHLYQAEGPYSAEGTGIGLYLVKGLVFYRGMNRKDAGKMTLHIEKVWSRFIIVVRYTSNSFFLARHVHRLGVDFAVTQPPGCKLVAFVPVFDGACSTKL